MAVQLEKRTVKDIPRQNYSAPLTIGKRLKRMDLLDYLGTNKKKTITKILVLVLAVILFVTVAFYLVSDLMTSINNESDGGNGVLIESVISIVTLIGTLYMCREISQNDDNEKTQITYNLCMENQNKREDENKARDQLRLLNEYVDELLSDDYISTGERSDLGREYYTEKYTELREYAYHLENIGNILMQKKVNFELLFNIVSFPDWIINESENLRIVSRARYVPDFWIGTEFLYRSYMVKRTYNNYLLRRPSEKDIDEYNRLDKKAGKNC